MASLDGMIKNINERMARAAATLGYNSELYKQYSATVTAMLSGTSAINIETGKERVTDESGKVSYETVTKVTISRGKKAEKEISKAAIEEIKAYMNRNSLQNAVKSIKEDIKKKKSVSGDKKKKITSQEIKKKAKAKRNSTERFQQLIDFMYDNKNEELSIEARNIYLSRVGQDERDYKSMVEFAKRAVQLRDKYIKAGKTPGKDFTDYGAFDDVKTGGDLFD